MKNILKPFAALVLAASPIIYSSCDRHGEYEPEPIIPANHIISGSETVEIHSALYNENPDGSVTVWLSPRRGVKYAENMTAVEDYLSVTSVAGGEYAITYKNRTVDSENADGINVAQTLVSDVLKLKISARLKSGSEFEAVYEGACPKSGEKPLTNSWRAGEEVTAIGSVVEFKGKDRNRIYVYESKGQDYIPADDGNEKYFVLDIAKGYDLSKGIDLAKADKEKLSVTMGDISSETAAEMSGRLRVTYAKSGKDLTVSIQGVIEGQRCECEYFGRYLPTYPRENYLKITGTEGGSEIFTTDSPVLFDRQSLSGHRIAFGMVTEPKTVEDLKKGKYSFELQLADLAKGNSIVGRDNNFVLTMNDYDSGTRPTTADEGAAGFVYTDTDPAGSENHVYMEMDITYPSGIRVECRYNGSLAMIEEDFDIAPEVKEPGTDPEPAEGKGRIILYGTDKTTVEKELEVTQLQIRHKIEMQASYFYFYFINEDTSGSSAADKVEDYVNTPVLRILNNFINTGEKTIPFTELGQFWTLKYSFDGVQPRNPFLQSKFNDYTVSPVEGSINVAKDGENYKISFFVKDETPKPTYANPVNTKKYLKLEWEGPVSDYTGNLPADPIQ